ncbi:MAG: hypothetical protein KatS3mg003_1239 [Candidatus Nitrosocaldaceae archaeon]|nr:MAG: hypothetical protein KatS3mg003_1239 [Candidatus Nitrosocaldaceae archaeon]
MFFLGHMVWAYLFAKPLKNVNIPLILFLGIVPDIDLLSSFVDHRSFTHSIPVITLLFIPFLYIYKKRALPYYIAITQHIFFGDLIVGKTQLFWPFDLTIGLGLELTSIENVIIESLGLGLFIIFIIKDRHELFTNNRNNIFMILPLIPVIIFPLIYAQYELEHTSISDLSYNIVQADTAFLIFILHLLLASIFILFIIDGLKGYMLRSKISKSGEK